MKTKARKTNMNVALKLAIVGSRHRTSKKVAQRARIGEVRLSFIVHGRPPEPSPEEKAALARVLDVDVEAIFPSALDAVSA